MKKGEKSEVVIFHRITVDSCLAEEIEELNNRYGVVTEWCCCGHGNKRLGFISVKNNSIPKMLKLGYEPTKTVKHCNRFIPKSVCKCKTTRKCSECGKVRRGWKSDHFLCYSCDYIGNKMYPKKEEGNGSSL